MLPPKNIFIFVYYTCVIVFLRETWATKSVAILLSTCTACES